MYQGLGRFDDPARLVSVVYGADSLETSLYETIDSSGLVPHSAGATIRAGIPAPTTDDEEGDARIDKTIARAPARIPPSFLRRRAVLLQHRDGPLNAYDLDSVRNRRIIADTPTVTPILARYKYRELDRSAITSSHRDLTQGIANEFIRGELVHSGDGISTLARRHGTIYAFICDGRFPLVFQEMLNQELNSALPTVKAVLDDLGITL
jgi:hypothetical protein